MNKTLLINPFPYSLRRAGEGFLIWLGRGLIEEEQPNPLNSVGTTYLGGGRGGEIDRHPTRGYIPARHSPGMTSSLEISSPPSE